MQRFLFFQIVAAVVVNIIIEMKLQQIMHMDNLEMESELSKPKNLPPLLVKLLVNIPRKLNSVQNQKKEHKTRVRKTFLKSADPFEYILSLVD
ncbi:hypothetical protein [Peribacillus sp. NPDC096540]|uniref:hypothetical protein n=1 Tax=Peribacillus sp. NPDC096540 TaxID=3390612 RepID=UPI003CFFC8DD